MTIPASTVPAAKTFLFNAITALLAADTTIAAEENVSALVTFDGPGTDQPADIVDVGKVDRDIEVIAFVGDGGQGWLNETYSITVKVSVFRGGDEAAAVFARAAFLVDLVVQAVRADPSLGSAVTVAYPDAVEYEGAWQADHMGRLCEATVTVKCSARI